MNALRIMKNFDENYRWKIFISNKREKELWIKTLLENSRLKIFELLYYYELELYRAKEL
jgi:hypothetical protein